MKTIKSIFLIIFFLLVSLRVNSQELRVKSPDGKIELEVKTGDAVSWAASFEGSPILSTDPISLELEDEVLGKDAKLRSHEIKEVRESSSPVVPRKSSEVENNYNELTLNFKGRFKIVFRVFNDGVAYRYETSFRNDITVVNEHLKVNFANDNDIYFAQEESYVSHFEPFYKHLAVASIADSAFASLPALLQSEKGINVLITEADLFDYPNMFISGTGGNALEAQFPQTVLETTPLEKRPERSESITKTADHIATTAGKRTFPWRIFVITDNDAALVESHIVYNLAKPLALENTDWIKPGKVAWDWYNANNLYNVDFRAGLNTDTYKYYIDFAAAHDLEYIILDEGWSKSTTDLTGPNEDLDLEELVAYGKTNDIGVILWMLWGPLNEDIEGNLDRFAAWDVKGIKVDFMQRADEDMVNFYENVAREAAERKLLVDFHGSYKPNGLFRTYPNVLTSEGVKGLENNKWSVEMTPDHNLTLPFLRMVAGPMDYTPGAMTNANEESFSFIFDTPMSQGTRAHQLAMYVIYESPLQMMADSPTQYYKEPESADFISRIPVTWDESLVLEAKVSDYIMMARRNNDTWYVGAMNDWTQREFDLDLSFLEEGTYQIEIMKDGINADRNANDYKKVIKEVTRDSKLKVSLAPGGGWAAIITKKG